jgi:peptidoglycan/LPS O-acetylase OafA/YrhL
VFGALEVGWVGVDLFFVLSGFLITRILLTSRDHDSYFQSFFARRALRILPLYYVTLLVVFALVKIGVLAGAFDAAPYFAIYLQNWLRLDGDHYRVKLLAHFWSLAIEEQFYLVWPVIVRVVSVRVLPWVCTAVVVGATLARLGLIATGTLEPRVVYFLTLTRADALALGGLLACAAVSARGRRWAAALWLPSLLVSAGVIAACWWRHGRFLSEDAGTAVWGLLAVELLFAAVLVATLMSPTTAWGAMLRRPALSAIGRISYGAYVLHWPVMVLMTKAWTLGRHVSYVPNQLVWCCATFGVTFAVAAISYRLLEAPLLALKRRFPTRPRSRHDDGQGAPVSRRPPSRRRSID